MPDTVVFNTSDDATAYLNATTPDNTNIAMSYSGCDIVAQIVLPREGPMILGELHTISYSIHRENTPLRTLGHVAPISFVKGPRTIAGSMIFTVFNQYLFYRLKWMQGFMSMGLFGVADQLPPFDIVISFQNEYGRLSKMAIYGVTIIDEGQTMSIDDMQTEQTYTFMARGIRPMTKWNNDLNSTLDGLTTGSSGSGGG